MTSVRLARDRAALSAALAGASGEGRRLALVPTMGALHEGHLGLVDEARRLADTVALSIFVNPLQFGPGEDLERYPRDLDRDLESAAARGVDLVFAPGTEEMFPHGEPAITVDPGEMGSRLCGAFRPGHFRGVLTLVARLFGLFRPDVAVFGRKDFQQGVLIRRMAEDLEMGVAVRLAPLVRESDGLALSSRNRYLTEDERAEAPVLFRALVAAEKAFRDAGAGASGKGPGPGGRARRDARRSGTVGAETVLSAARRVLEASPTLRVQYVELVDPGTLEPVDRVQPGDVLAVAGFLGSTRLIDNLELGSDEGRGPGQRSGASPRPRGPVPGRPDGP